MDTVIMTDKLDEDRLLVEYDDSLLLLREMHCADNRLMMMERNKME